MHATPPPPPGRFALTAVCVALGIAGHGPEAHAGDTAVQYTLDTYFQYMPTLPQSLGTPDIASSGRTIPSGSVGQNTGSAFIGSTFNLSLSVSQRVVVPLFGLQFASAAGGSPAVITSIDGTIVQLQPWTSNYFALLLPGIGLRFHSRHFMVQAHVQTGLSLLWSGGAVADSASTYFSAWAASFLVRADLEVCYRFDPTLSLCGFAMPSVYEYGTFNGGLTGVRMEFGP